jgi:hypothetical protein
MVLMPLSRSGSAILVCASALIADQQVSHADAEMPGDRGHGVVVVPQRVDRPRRRPGGELGAGRGVGLDLGPGPTSTRRFGTPPDPLAPSHPHRPCEARSVVQQLDSAAVADRDHPAVRTASEDVVGLDLEQHAAVLAGGHIEDVHALDTEQFISPRHRPRDGDGPQAHVECANVRVFQEKQLGRRRS